MPTETVRRAAQIKATLSEIKKRLADPAMLRPINRAVRQGYTECLTILAEDRRTYDGIDLLSIQQGRAIAVLGVDYLNGECESKVLLGVPLKS